MPYSNFVQRFPRYLFEHMDTQRTGQASFNLIAEIRPELANRIRGTEFDAFYDDTKTQAMWQYAEEHWDDDDV